MNYKGGSSDFPGGKPHRRRLNQVTKISITSDGAKRLSPDTTQRRAQKRL